jgi:hypothetical protein
MGGEVTDFLTALRSYLLGQQAITDLCGRSIYVLAMPKEELELGPHEVVVILASVGKLGAMRRTITEARVDLVCFGATDLEAAILEMPVAEAMKSLNRELWEGVLLHNATVASGPFQARDPETFWPCMRRQAILRADERKVG